MTVWTERSMNIKLAFLDIAYIMEMFQGNFFLDRIPGIGEIVRVLDGSRQKYATTAIRYVTFSLRKAKAEPMVNGTC